MIHWRRPLLEPLRSGQLEPIPAVTEIDSQYSTDTSNMLLIHFNESPLVRWSDVFLKSSRTVASHVALCLQPPVTFTILLGMEAVVGGRRLPQLPCAVPFHGITWGFLCENEPLSQILS